MSANVIETEESSRRGARASRTAVRHPTVPPQPDGSNHAFIEQRRRRRVQKKQLIDRARRLMNDDTSAHRP